MTWTPRLLCCALLLLSGCALQGPRQLPVVEARWVSEAARADVLDTVAVWITPAGDWQLVATAKSGGRLRIHDAADGRFLRPLGSEGEGAGQFRYPNGLFVAGDLAFVVERDGARVQVIDLARNLPLGSFGEAELHTPYGAWVWPQGEGRYRVYVTDSYYTPDRQVPPDSALGERVKLYEVTVGGDGLQSRLLRAFGQTRGEGRLLRVESIWGDPTQGRLLVADEHDSQLNIKVYDLEGNYTGPVFGTGVFRFEPEGITLATCPDDQGYVLVSDQDQHDQRIQVFDRVTLAHLGAFRPGIGRMIDGIWFQAGSYGPFRQGALFTQHDDEAVMAFDWRDIATAMGLRDDCGT
ncbi:MAG: phytase [Xanthomonadales bacterium]|nr:phytase [Xanthomonadales bacterium]